MGADVLGRVLIRTIHPAESWQKIPSRPGQSQGVKSLKIFLRKFFRDAAAPLDYAQGVRNESIKIQPGGLLICVGLLIAWRSIPKGPPEGAREGFEKRSFEKPLSAPSCKNMF